MAIYGVLSCARLAGVPLQDKPANGPHIQQSPSSYPKSTLKSLAFAQGPMESTPEAMRCKQGVLVGFSHLSTCPLGERRM